MKTNNGGPAFARAGSEDRRQGDMPDGNKYDEPKPGMSLRQWYAGQALAGVLASCAGTADVELMGEKRAAKFAFQYADAMIAAEAAQPVEGRSS